MQRIRKGDEVIVIAGKNKGGRGRVLRVYPDDRVLVENVNMVKRHTKPNPQMGTAGGILEQEKPLHISNVMLFNPSTRRGDKVGFRWLADGTKVRYFRSTGETVDS